VVIRRESSNATVNIGFHCYMCTNVIFQNCIAIDGVGTSYAYADFGQATRSSSNGHGGNRYMGCISMNSDTYAFRLDDNDSAHITINDPMAKLEHCLAIDPSASCYGVPGSSDAQIEIENCNAYQAGGSGNGFDLTSLAAGGHAKNLVAFGNGGTYGVRTDYTSIYSNSYGYSTAFAPSGGTGNRTTDPTADGGTPSIKYPCRIESGSLLETAGEGGGVCGANIVKRYGVDGTHYGESGWDTLTATDLWPFPNQDTIRSQMRVTSSAVADPTRGFCASGETLTHYIWNLLGNGSPYEETGSIALTPAAASASAEANIVTAGNVINVPADYSTIQGAANVVIAGDKVVVAAGTYAGFHVDHRDGTENNRITFEADGEVILDSAGPTYDPAIHVEDSSYLTFDGFTITGSTNRGIACRGAGPTEPTAMKGLWFKNNTITGWGAGEAMYLSEVWGGVVENNLIDGTNGPGGQRDHGIYLANAGSKNTIIRDNEIRNITGSESQALHVNGDLSTGGDGLITGLLIERNHIHDYANNALNFDGVQDSTIQNNLIEGGGRHCLRAYGPPDGDGAEGPKNLSLINNTFDSEQAWAVKLSSDAGGHTVFNNTLHGASGALCVGDTGIKSDYNRVDNVFSADEESSTISLSSWQTATGEDANTVVASQTSLFNDYANDDFGLKFGSPSLDTGVETFNGVTAPNHDIDLGPRPVGPAPVGPANDIGAYEFDNPLTNTARAEVRTRAVAPTIVLGSATVSGVQAGAGATALPPTVSIAGNPTEGSEDDDHRKWQESIGGCGRRRGRR
jgi:hypothetical protein